MQLVGGPFHIPGATATPTAAIACAPVRAAWRCGNGAGRLTHATGVRCSVHAATRDHSAARATYVGATAAALPLPVCRALLAVRAVRADFMDRTDATDRAAPDRTEMADTDTTEPASSVPSARRRGFFCGGGEVHVWG